MIKLEGIPLARRAASLNRNMRAGVVGRAVAFFVPVALYVLLFLLWRALWARELIHLSAAALVLFFVSEYVLVRAHLDEPLRPFGRMLGKDAAAFATAAVRGLVLCLPAVVMLKMMRSLSWTAVFIPFVYEAQMSLFASRLVVFGFWTLAVLLPFGIFLLLRRFRSVLSVYVPLAVIFAGFLSIYNAYDGLVRADENLDGLVEVVLPSDRLVELSGTNGVPIARDI